MAKIIEGGFNVPLPKMVPIQQLFLSSKAVNIDTVLQQTFMDNDRCSRIKPNSNIAIAVGSRGIQNIKQIVFELIQRLKKIGVKPFIVPAMGSHGGATAEGQEKILAEYGLTSDSMGVPIKSSMKTRLIGSLEDGVPIYLDEQALNSDGIIVVNRIKPHTGFRADYESGLLKMMVIGLGKHQGATIFHNYGLDKLGDNLPIIGQIIMERAPIIGGLAIVENSYHEVTHLEFIWHEDILSREKELLKIAKKLLPKIQVDDIDILIVNDFGKEISGPGMDPNVTGRPVSPFVKIKDSITLQKIVVLNLTEASEGNAVGIGMADVTTKKFVDRIDFGYTYANVIASTFLNAGKIPVYLNNDFEAIQVALKTCRNVKHPQSRIVWIKNTMRLDRIFVSEALLEEIGNRPNMKIAGKPMPMSFDEDGNILYPS